MPEVWTLDGAIYVISFGNKERFVIEIDQLEFKKNYSAFGLGYSALGVSSFRD